MDFPKIDYARFTDVSRTLIRYETATNIETGLATIEHVTFDMNDPLCQHIVDTVGMVVLEQNTLDFQRDESLQYEAFAKFYDRHEDYQRVIEFIDEQPGDTLQNKIENAKAGFASPEVKTITVPAPITLKGINMIETDQESFFRLKLEVFELPEVKSSTDRKWKAKMRKATTTLELLAHLYEAYSAPDNAEA